MPWSGPTTGLTHRWQLDDGDVSGSTVNDLVGSDNGTISGGVVSGTAPPGAFALTCRHFDGATSTAITLASNPISSLTGAFSVGVWAYWDDVTYNPSGTDPRVLAFVDATPTQLHIINDPAGAVGGNSSSLIIQTQNNIGAALQNFGCNGELASLTWYHIVVTFDGASSFLVYVNGSLLASNFTPNNLSFVTFTSSVIGNRNLDRRYLGRIYQVVTYNVVLSAGNVVQLYQADAGIPPPQPLLSGHFTTSFTQRVTVVGY